MFHAILKAVSVCLTLKMTQSDLNINQTWMAEAWNTHDTTSPFYYSF